MSPEDQIIRPWLRGDEGYRLTNLHSGHLTAQGQLSKPGFAVQLDWRQDALILLTWRIPLLHGLVCRTTTGPCAIKAYCGGGLFGQADAKANSAARFVRMAVGQ